MTLYTRLHLGHTVVRPLIGLVALLFVLLTGTLYYRWYTEPHAGSKPGSHWTDGVVHYSARPPLNPHEGLPYQQIPLQPAWEPYTPRNSTLGFEAILALSKTGPSWRRQGLLAAAELSGLSIAFPPQPSWSKPLAAAFEQLGDDGSTKPQHGSALAWLAHIDLLKFIIQSELNSALVLEDDVDWDVNIKDQMSLIADAVRNHTAAPEDDIHPYSHLWDVLWIGHCGDNPRTSEHVTAFSDSTVVPRASYKGWALSIFSRISAGQRAVYASDGAVCTFAYAVNKPGARKVLDFVGDGQDEAFDIKLMHGCRSEAFRCIAVNPEVMRHFRPDARFGQSSEVGKANDDKASDDVNKGSVEEEGDREEGDFGPLRLDVAREVQGTTENIMESARCRRLFRSTCLA